MSTNPPNTPSENSAQDLPEQPADTQLTEIFPPADTQTTQAYPTPPTTPADVSAGADAAPAAYGQPPQSYAPAPGTPDTRSKRIAWIALVLAVIGTVASLVGFVPVAWVGLVAVAIGGLLLLAGFIFAIVGLAGKKNGGKGLSIAALIISVIGAIIGFLALLVALVFSAQSFAEEALTGSSTEVSATPSAEASAEASDDTATEEGTEDGTDEASTAAGEEAFLAEVRPKVTEIFTSIDPSITTEMIDTAYPDETLLMLGQTLLYTGDSGLDALIDQVYAQSTDDSMSEDQLRELFQVILDSAEAHLQ